MLKLRARAGRDAREHAWRTAGSHGGEPVLFAASRPPPFVAWSVLWIAGVLAAALWSFRREV